jgi:hypothetical protein
VAKLKREFKFATDDILTKCNQQVIEMQTRLQDLTDENMKIKMDQEKKIAQMKDTVEHNIIKVNMTKLK